ncbi:MAG: hypothetical protein JRF64_01855 [Deltaproteobacteria bacterium]|nr:hypothetical protein [Deltaproteobacteria bacterium]
MARTLLLWCFVSLLVCPCLGPATFAQDEPALPAGLASEGKAAEEPVLPPGLTITGTDSA